MDTRGGASARWPYLGTNFAKSTLGEVRRILLLGTDVKIALAAAHFHGFGVARQGPWVTSVNKASPHPGRAGPPGGIVFLMYSFSGVPICT
jgi:hypothetical protein